MSETRTRRFQLHRDKDISGVSGVGVVAEGVQFPDGSCAMRWPALTSGAKAATAIWPDVESIELVHGHNGATRVVFLDA